MGEYAQRFSEKPYNLVGTLKSHTWRDVITPQFHVIDAF